LSLSSRGRRIVAFGVAVAASLAAIAFVIAAASREPPPRAGVRPSPAASTLAPSTSPRIRVVSTRDPFSPPPALDRASEAASPGAGGRATTPPGTIGEPPAGTGPSPPPTSPSPQPTSPPPPSAPPPPTCDDAPARACFVAGPHVVELARVTKRHGSPLADLAVDDRPYPNVAEHERFARRFRLVGFNELSCAHVVFRRQGFTLCPPRTR
jgi:hypothetical protein